MKEFMLYSFTIALAAVLFGLMLYSFYIVLTSKDEKSIEEDTKQAEKPLNKTKPVAPKTPPAKPSPKSPRAA